MAERLDSILTNGKLVVKDGKEELVLSLPKVLEGVGGNYLSEELLSGLLIDRGLLHVVMQKGLAQLIIDVRAAGRGAGKEDVLSDGKAQERINDLSWKPQTTASGASKTAKVYESVLAKLLEAGLSEEEAESKAKEIADLAK